MVRHDFGVVAVEVGDVKLFDGVIVGWLVHEVC